MFRTFSLLLFFLLLHPLQALAEDGKLQVYELNWIDKNHLKNQVERIDELARSELGTQIHNNRDDLELLQRIVNKGLVEQKDRLTLQAMGIVLGNLLVEELGLKWMVYEDRHGRSRATCVEDTNHCLFPVTMLSRRMEVGIIANVTEIYTYAAELIIPYLPKNPYDE